LSNELIGQERKRETHTAKRSRISIFVRFKKEKKGNQKFIHKTEIIRRNSTLCIFNRKGSITIKLSLIFSMQQISIILFRQVNASELETFNAS